MKSYAIEVVIFLYILLLASFFTGGLSNKFKYVGICACLFVLAFFLFMPLYHYHLPYEYSGYYEISGPHWNIESVAFGRTLAILKHFGEPIRTLVLIQPIAYFTGKMCFEVYKTILGACR